MEDTDAQTIEPEFLTRTISAVDKCRARSAHHAARIRVGIVKSREGQSCEEQSKLTQQCQTIAAAGGPSFSSGVTPLSGLGRGKAQRDGRHDADRRNEARREGQDEGDVGTLHRCEP